MCCHCSHDWGRKWPAIFTIHLLSNPLQCEWWTKYFVIQSLNQTALLRHWKGSIHGNGLMTWFDTCSQYAECKVFDLPDSMIDCSAPQLQPHKNHAYNIYNILCKRNGIMRWMPMAFGKKMLYVNWWKMTEFNLNDALTTCKTNAKLIIQMRSVQVTKQKRSKSIKQGPKMLDILKKGE